MGLIPTTRSPLWYGLESAEYSAQTLLKSGWWAAPLFGFEFLSSPRDHSASQLPNSGGGLELSVERFPSFMECSGSLYLGIQCNEARIKLRNFRSISVGPTQIGSSPESRALAGMQSNTTPEILPSRCVPGYNRLDRALELVQQEGLIARIAKIAHQRVFSIGI